MNPLAGLLGMLESRKGNSFLLGTGALAWFHSNGAPWYVMACGAGVSVAYIVVQGIVDLHQPKAPPKT